MVNISQSYFLVQTVLFKINVWVFVCWVFFLHLQILLNSPCYPITSNKANVCIN